MINGIIFDLDQTLVNSVIAESFRRQKNWQTVYSLIPKFSLYEGIPDLFEYISKKGIRTCIVTTSQKKYAGLVIEYFKIPVEFVVDYYSTQRIKPFPDPMLKALDLFDLKNDEVLSFGDRAIDIEASNAAGIKSVACLWGTQERELLLRSNPTFIIDLPLDITNYL